MSSRLSSRLRWRQSNVAGPLAARSVGPVAQVAALGAGGAAAGAAEPVGHEPRLAPRDEAIYLLHVAAEVEHALLAQYLYASFSLRRSVQDLTPEQQALVAEWRKTIFQIAKEEMAHLLAVQNVLRLLGGPLNMEREDYPFRSDVYPFHFRLEPLTKDVLAKYVFAESAPTADYPEKDDVRVRATKAEPSGLNHVGAIYDAILARLGELTDADIRKDDTSLGYQAPREEWAFGRPGPDAPGGVDPNLIIDRVKDLPAAIDLLKKIAQQGEAGENPSPGQGGQPSHFARFLAIFRRFPEDAWRATDPLPENPNTARDPIEDSTLEKGRITQPLARRWAQLFDARYRMLLMDLIHLLHIGSDTKEVDGTVRDTRRPQVRGLAFAEMGNLAEICEQVVQLPLREDGSGGLVAGPCFELPYTLALPLLELDRWRLHRDLAADTVLLVNAIRDLTDTADPNSAGALALLDRLENGDRIRAATLIGPRILELGGEAPPSPPATPGFEKDIRPLFRPMDIAHMKAVFPEMDFANYEIVKAKRARIAAALKRDPLIDGSMPSDAPWPAAAIALFDIWVLNPLQ
jgi:hypothetical protein